MREPWIQGQVDTHCLHTLKSWPFTRGHPQAGSELPRGQHKIGDHQYEATISPLLRRRNPNSKLKKHILYWPLIKRTL